MENNTLTAVPGISDITLSALPIEDQAIAKKRADDINVLDTTQVLSYGDGAQKKLTDFADAALSYARNKDTGVVGDTLAGLVVQLQGFSAGDEKKGLLSIFKRGAKEIATMKARFDKVSVSVDSVANTLENHRIGLLKDIAMFDRLYGENMDYYKQLCVYIAAGKTRIAELRDNDLPRAFDLAKESGGQIDAQKANDLQAAIDRFEKRVFDLELTRQISIQMAPQIRLLQNNDSLLADKIQSALNNTLPLWKSQMVMALGLENSRQALKAQQAVSDATNQMLKQNAEALKQGTIGTAKEAERSIVDIDTLVKTNQDLIDTLTAVETIQREGRQQRLAAEVTLHNMEDKLKDKLIEVRSNSINR